ncbi:MAG: YhcH/YjgK/YiaL family protein [Bacteroidales bacterium]
MKNLFLTIMAVTTFLGILSFRNSTDPSKWSTKQVNKWFDKGEWLNGWQVKPDPSINRRELAISYFKHKERWDKAFAFLKGNDLMKMELKRYELDGTNLYATISEYMSKNPEDVRYEEHKKYIDIQYVVNGNELIGIAPLSQQKDVLEPYNEAKDIMNVSVIREVTYKATPDRFFIFFPVDFHRPGLKDGTSTLVRKVVIKVKVD